MIYNETQFSLFFPYTSRTQKPENFRYQALGDIIDSVKGKS